MKSLIKKIKIPLNRSFRKISRLSGKYSPPSILIEVLFGNSKKTGAFASFLYGFPVCAVLCGFLISRQLLVIHDSSTVVLVFLAATWSWIGPLFIWRYEHITNRKYWAMCRKVVVTKRDLYITRNMFNKTVQSSLQGRLVLIAWCSVIITVFISSYDFMRGFGVVSKTDIWWYFQVCGVAVYAYLTGIGFMLVDRTFLLIVKFLPINTIIDPYNLDERGGLGFIGTLLSETSLMFASGALYIPILMKLHMTFYLQYSNALLAIIGLYAIMIAMSFMVPMWLIHKKLVLEKSRKMAELSNSLCAIKSNTKEWSLEQYLEYKIRRDEYSDVAKIMTWPFDFSNAITVFSSITLPIILTVWQLALQNPK